MTNMNSVRLKAKELLRFYSGCHGDLVTTTAMYVLSRKLLTIIKIKTMELLTFYFGCHGNWVTIATMYVSDVYCPMEPPYQIQVQ